MPGPREGHRGVSWLVHSWGTALLVLLAVLVPPTPALGQTAAPGFVYATAVRGNHVVVNWEQTATTVGTITYFVYRATATDNNVPAFPGASWTEISGGVVGRMSNSFIDDDPKANGSRYWYVVTADSSSDTESLASPTQNGLAARYLCLNGTTMQTGADYYKLYIGPTTLEPLEPRGVVLSGADGTITVSWNAVPSTNISAYHIYREEASGAEGVVVGSVSGNVTTFADTTVERYRHYWYRVAAEDSLGRVGYRSIEEHYRTVSSADIPAPHGGSGSSGDCTMCHDTHAAPTAELIKSDLHEVTLCLACHDGTGSKYDVLREYTDPKLSAHQVEITDGDGNVVTPGPFVCADCHTPHGDPDAVGSKKLLDVDGVTEGNGVCYGSGCHGPNSPGHWSGDFTPFELSDHNHQIEDPESGTKVKCSTCHQPHASPNSDLWTSSSYRACLQCHSEDSVTLGSPDIYTRLTANADNDSHHDVLLRDQVANGTYMACQNCHNTHITTESTPLIDPDDPSLGGAWAESTAAPLAVPNNQASPRPRYNTFCYGCHDGVLPDYSAPGTSGWVAPPEDNGSLVTLLSVRFPASNHGDGEVTNGSPALDAAMGYVNNDSLSCMTCHEPHGTINNYNLRSDVPAKNGTYPKSGRLLAYVLTPTGDRAAERYDVRFFCMSCHVNTGTSPSQHFTDTVTDKTLRYFPTSCTNKDCHVHNTTSVRRF